MKNYFVLVAFLAVVGNGCSFMGDAFKGVGEAMEKEGKRREAKAAMKNRQSTHVENQRRKNKLN